MTQLKDEYEYCIGCALNRCVKNFELENYMAQMSINEAVAQVELMCKYSKDFAALEAIRAFVAEVQNSSHNKPSAPCPHENTEWHEMKLCTDCGAIIDQCT